MATHPWVDGQLTRSIFVINNQPIIHLGLQAILNGQTQLKLSGWAAPIDQALDSIDRHPPDLFIVGLWFADRSGLDVIHHLKEHWPHTPSLALSIHDEMIFARQVLHAGARGYVMTNASPATILAAIHRVLQGNIYVSELVASHILQTSVCGQHAQADLLRLSERELEVYELIARRRSLHEIAHMLRRSVKTIEPTASTSSSSSASRPAANSPSTPLNGSSPNESQTSAAKWTAPRRLRPHLKTNSN